MNSETVDKLAEKIGLAAEKLQPLAEETLRQFQMRAGLWFTITGLAAFLCFSGLTYCVWLGVRGSGRDECGCRLHPDGPDDDVLVFAAASLFVFGGVTAGIALINLGHYLAPLPSMLGL